MSYTCSIPLCLVLLATAGLLAKGKPDVNIVGLIGTETTMPLVGTTIIDVLRTRFSVNLISSRPHLTASEQSIFKQDLPFDPHSLSRSSRHLAPLSLLTDVIGYKDNPFYQNVPPSLIKIAYSMFEATRLPQMWVDAINTSFDAVVVPDQHLITIYQKSGVKKPIFSIPLPIYLEKLYSVKSLPTKTKPVPFVFGISAGFSVRKNYDTLLTAFSQEFGADPNVILKIHGSWGDPALVRAKAADLGLKNILIFDTTFSRTDYIEYLSSLNAYVYPSTGEGYSLTPREALALAIPCILSYHTVHKSIRALGILRVPARTLVKAHFDQFDDDCGYFHHCSVGDLRKALRTMYNDYSHFKQEAWKGRTWTRKFLRSELAPLFATLIHPAKITLGNTNSITSSQLTTNDLSLYRKYRKLYPQVRTKPVIKRRRKSRF